MNATATQLTQELGAFSRQRGADLFGVADLAPVEDYLAAHGDPLVGRFPRAVSIGMRLNDAIVDGHSPDEKHRESLYWHHVYDVVSASLNFVAYDVARWLHDRDYETFPVPASMPYKTEKLEGALTHKLPAHLAGLGWIGKSCLLLTKEFGPRVRFVSVLTDAPLETGSSLDRQCGKCRACVEACPVGAFTGVEFDPADALAVRFDAPRCSEYRHGHPCGLCVSSCPAGKRRPAASEVSAPLS
jgi:epoxyqueuosine reductase QueG